MLYCYMFRPRKNNMIKTSPTFSLLFRCNVWLVYKIERDIHLGKQARKSFYLWSQINSFFTHGTDTYKQTLSVLLKYLKGFEKTSSMAFTTLIHFRSDQQGLFLLSVVISTLSFRECRQTCTSLTLLIYTIQI